MSRLEELIRELCPDGVEYKPLKDIGVFYGGLTGKSKEDFANGNAKYITYMNVFSNHSVDTNMDSYVKIGNKEKQNLVAVGDILFTGSSESREESGMSSVLTHACEEALYLNSFCFGLRLHDTNTLWPDFSKHLFRSSSVRKQIIRTASGVTRFNISKDKMGKVVVPLPPLPIQRKIVQYLDNFTELTAELTAELEKRKVQYEYYRNMHIQSGNSFPQIQLSDILDMRAGKNISVIDISDSKKNEFPFPCYGGNGLRGYVRKSTHNQSAVIIGRQGALCGNVKRVTGEFYPTEHAVVVSPKQDQDIDIDWVFHILSAMNLNQYATKSAQPGLSVKRIEKLSIPVPPLSEQARIVAILDRFDALVNDITQGLPAEIAARRKQYEYYRDKLLTFKRKEPAQ